MSCSNGHCVEHGTGTGTFEANIGTDYTGPRTKRNQTIRRSGHQKIEKIGGTQERRDREEGGVGNERELAGDQEGDLKDEADLPLLNLLALAT